MLNSYIYIGQLPDKFSYDIFKRPNRKFSNILVLEEVVSFTNDYRFSSQMQNLFIINEQIAILPETYYLLSSNIIKELKGVINLPELKNNEGFYYYEIY